MLTAESAAKTRYPAGNHRLPDTTGYQFIGMDHFARPDDELAVPSVKACCIVTSRATPLRAIPSAGDGRFRHQHDWRLLRAEQKELKQYYQQVDEQGNALWRVLR